MTFKYWYISRWVRKTNVKGIFINKLKLVTVVFSYLQKMKRIY